MSIKERKPVSVLPLAVVVGMLLFFLTETKGGSQTGVQWFFVGVAGVLALYLICSFIVLYWEKLLQSRLAATKPLVGQLKKQ